MKKKLTVLALTLVASLTLAAQNPPPAPAPKTATKTVTKTAFFNKLLVRRAKALNWSSRDYGWRME